jgi:hypothetical protein
MPSFDCKAEVSNTHNFLSRLSDSLWLSLLRPRIQLRKARLRLANHRDDHPDGTAPADKLMMFEPNPGSFLMSIFGTITIKGSGGIRYVLDPSRAAVRRLVAKSATSTHCHLRTV